MISFPLLRRLSVSHYELYPGADGSGLEARFEAGITLIIGANGLGKSTLVTLLYRMLAGATELAGVGRSELGSGQLDLRRLRSEEVRAFSARVQDGAADARATLEFSLSTDVITVTRNLRSLSIEALVVNGDDREPSEEEFQRAVLNASGLSEYLDWILTLRYLVFYFDDRRSLVWDPTAQRRLLRLLFLPGAQALPERELAAQILSQDSYYRNVSATLNRQEQEFKRQEQAAHAQGVTELELEAESERLAAASSELDSIRVRFSELHDIRATRRLEALRAEQEHDDALTAVEELRFHQVRAAFPSSSESGAYWLTQLLSERDCIVCGTHVPAHAEQISERLRSGRCVMCDSEDIETTTALAPGDQTAAELRLAVATNRLHVAKADRDVVETEYQELIVSVARTEAEVSRASGAVERLQTALPAAAQEVTRRRQALADLRMENALLKERVLADKLRYAELVEQQNVQISEYQERIKETFDRYANDFLLESCALVWGQVNEQLGQVGQPIKFSVFRVDMTGGAFTLATRRDTAEQVSESQREFIDLSFRMSLIRVASEDGAGSLVVDAPESSLDAVFAPRAARVLTQFGGGDGDESRVVLTSNLVDGQLIPTIAQLSGISGADDPRVINLFRIAAPTAALRQLRVEYDRALDRAFTTPSDQ